MFRHPSDAQRKDVVNCLITDGGMGDLLCALVPVNFVLNTHTWITLQVWLPDYLVDFAKNVLPKKAIVRSYSDAQAGKYNETLPGISTAWKSFHTPMRTHPVKYAYHMMADMDPDDVQSSYLKIDSSKINLSKFTLPENYAVVGLGSTTKVKEFPVETVNAVSDFLLSKGLTPVYVGSTKTATGYNEQAIISELTQADTSKGIDLTNKTSVLDLAGIMSGARLFVGMDGGLMHLAGFTDIPIVAGFTFASPSHLLPIREGVRGKNCFPVEPPLSLGCRFCQTNMSLYFDHDYRDCYYKDYQCNKDMTPERFIEQIKNALQV